MKVEDLRTLEITTDFESVVELKSKDSPLCASIGFGTWADGFETITEAGKAAALFRASHKMQDVLKSVQGYAEDLPRGICQQIADALAFSENTAETVTP